MSNLGGVRHGHLTLTTIAKEYTSHMGYEFVPPQNPDDFPPIMGTTQEQALGTEKFRQNQTLFRRYTAVDGSIKKKIVMAVEPFFL